MARARESDWCSASVPRGGEALIRWLRAYALESFFASPFAMYLPGDEPSIADRAALLFTVFKNFGPGKVRDIVSSMPTFFTMADLDKIHYHCDHVPRE